jgi:hypothetical protein
MNRATLFVLAGQMGADDALAENVVTFIEYGWAGVTTDRPMASPAWFKLMQPLLEKNPAASAIGLSILGKHYQSIIEPKMALKLLAKSYEAMKSEARRQGMQDKVEKKKMKKNIADCNKKLRDVLTQETAEATSPEVVEVIQAFAKETLGERLPEPEKLKVYKKKTTLLKDIEKDIEKDLEEIEEAERDMQEVMTKGLADSDCPELSDLIHSLTRGTLEKSAAFKAKLKAELEAVTELKK